MLLSLNAVVKIYIVFTALTKRQKELVQHKTYHPAFKPDRFSPKSLISLAAMHATPSMRISELAKHKPFHPDWIAMRSYDTHIPHPALHTTTPDRFDRILLK